ncbi:acyl--CoA ligase [candidate division KSB1 bacterium]|nr:acyl--CoA ligase [candidate division KSB1 bacterium]
MNYCDYLYNAPKEWYNNPALIDAGTDTSFTYGELADAVRNLAYLLTERGFRPHEVISTHLYNSAEAVIAHLAIQHIGCTTCLLDPLTTAEGLRYYLEDNRSVALLSHLDVASVKAFVPDNVQIIRADEVKTMYQTPANRIEKLFDCAPDAVTSIFYTSGTTSRPKGVLLANRNYRAHVAIFERQCYQYDPDDVLLCFVPFSHGYGSKSIFLPCLHAGATMVILRSFHPLNVIKAIESYKVTHIFGVPAHYQQLLRREEFYPALRKIKCAFCAAAPLTLETAHAWKQKIDIHLDEGYGLIETCTGVAFRRNRMPDRMGNLGSYPADLVEIEICDDDDTLLPANQRGEIVVRGASVMQGYLNQPEETAKAIRDGWFHTGDMGYKTEQNELIMTGRIKDVINIAGIKVAPFEIEAVLNEHPDIHESAVIGVDNEMYGEVVKAFVKPKNGKARDERDLIVYLQKKLMNFQVPKEIVFLDEFPRNNMGKIDKKALRAL